MSRFLTHTHKHAQEEREKEKKQKKREAARPTTPRVAEDTINGIRTEKGTNAGKKEPPRPKEEAATGTGKKKTAAKSPVPQNAKAVAQVRDSFGEGMFGIVRLCLCSGGCPSVCVCVDCVHWSAFVDEPPPPSCRRSRASASASLLCRWSEAAPRSCAGRACGVPARVGSSSMARARSTATRPPL